MRIDPRTLLDFVLATRVREICDALDLSAAGSRDEQRERIMEAIAGDVRRLLPLLMRTELVEFLATRDLGGRYALVNKASRFEMERLIAMLCVGDAHAIHEQPLGTDSVIRFERRVIRATPTRSPPSSPRHVASKYDAPSSEKVFRARVQRKRGFIYYVKDGDIWAAPGRNAGSRRKPRMVHEVGLSTDHLTYLYYVDGDGDIARKRRDGAGAHAAPSGDDDDDPIRVFIGYARDDRPFLEELLKALAPHESCRDIDIYCDIRAAPGTEWEPALMDVLASAEIAIVLVSNDFFGSRYCIEEEWPRIESRYRRGECELAPVLIRECAFERSPVGAHQLIRPNDKAVDDQRRDPAWKQVTRSLEQLIDRVRAKKRR